VTRGVVASQKLRSFSELPNQDLPPRGLLMDSSKKDAFSTKRTRSPLLPKHGALVILSFASSWYTRVARFRVSQCPLLTSSPGSRPFFTSFPPWTHESF